MAGPYLYEEALLILEYKTLNVKSSVSPSSHQNTFSATSQFSSSCQILTSLHWDASLFIFFSCKPSCAFVCLSTWKRGETVSRSLSVKFIPWPLRWRLSRRQDEWLGFVQLWLLFTRSTWFRISSQGVGFEGCMEPTCHFLRQRQAEMLFLEQNWRGEVTGRF